MSNYQEQMLKQYLPKKNAKKAYMELSQNRRKNNKSDLPKTSNSRAIVNNRIGSTSPNRVNINEKIANDNRDENDTISDAIVSQALDKLSDQMEQMQQSLVYLTEVNNKLLQLVENMHSDVDKK